ncbi:MAG: hypothetical protein H6835_09205 [Planctomycetes bacterium]|nr:hypothetical protein [Planctomycetota bacterium]
MSGEASGQQLVLPYFSTLTESQQQEGSNGASTWWADYATRFQVVYDAENFLDAGVSGPITITRLRFRAEDGESNLGGQVFQNVQIELGSTSVASTFVSSNWSVNRAAATLAPPFTTTVVVAPASGAVPNDYVIDIDLLALGGAFTFDATGPERNLFLEVTLPNAPVGAAPLSLVPFQDGTPYHCRGVYRTAFSSSGHLSNKPPVMAIEFVGSGGSTALIPATNEYLGASCGGSPSAFYERFLTGDQFDLGGGLTITPDVYPSPTVYTVTAGAPPVDGGKVNAVPSSVADSAAVPHPLGFTFSYPGGSTNVVSPDTDGNVQLISTTFSDAFPSIDKFLGKGVTTTYWPRFSLFWHDLHAGRNTATHPNSGLHVLTDTSGGPGNAVFYATWLDVGRSNSVTGVGVGGHGVFTMQCAIHQATGVVEFRYGAMGMVGAGSASSDISAMVGFSRGIIGGFGGVRSVDPQTRDLSAELPFTTMVEGTRANLRLRPMSATQFPGPNYGARMWAGQHVRWDIDNFPANASIGALVLDLTHVSPGLQIPGLIAPGCHLGLVFDPLAWQVFPLQGVGTVSTTPLTVPSGAIGAVVYSQFLVLDGLFGAPELVTASSNVLKQTVGLP